MKRKLDEYDAPVPTVEVEKSKEESSFASLALDSRILQAIAKQNFVAPTLVQKRAIPLTLEGKDILARAKTGSGKTAAYLLPILHSILKRKQVGSFDTHFVPKLILQGFFDAMHFSPDSRTDPRTRRTSIQSGGIVLPVLCERHTSREPCPKSVQCRQKVFVGRFARYRHCNACWSG